MTAEDLSCSRRATTLLVNDGKLIGLALPTPTEERRKQLVKTVAKMAGDARVAVRNIRREANEKLKAAAKDKKSRKTRNGERTIRCRRPPTGSSRKWTSCSRRG